MPLQFSVAVNDARNDAIETSIGTSPILRIRTLAPPVNCAAARTGVILASMTLPVDWAAASSGGTKAKSGTWQVLSAAETGVAGHFEIMDSTGTTCHAQGTVTATGNGGDMTVANTTITAGQSVTVETFSIVAGNQ